MWVHAIGMASPAFDHDNSGWLKHNKNSSTVDELADRFRDLGFDIETATPWQTGPASDGTDFHVRDVLYRDRSVSHSSDGWWLMAFPESGGTWPCAGGVVHRFAPMAVMPSVPAVGGIDSGIGRAFCAKIHPAQKIPLLNAYLCKAQQPSFAH